MYYVRNTLIVVFMQCYNITYTHFAHTFTTLAKLHSIYVVIAIVMLAA